MRKDQAHCPKVDASFPAEGGAESTLQKHVLCVNCECARFHTDSDLADVVSVGSYRQ